MATIRIGISGWRYEPWRGSFYPADLPQRSELAYASHVLPVIEINGSFYSLQRPESYARWYEETPPGFVFTVKAPRYITHMRRLREVEEPLANFFASGLFNLEDKLGPILWQFPPNFKYDRARMEPFLELLPHDTAAASVMARKRSAWMKGRTCLAAGAQRPVRHAIEIRHESFLEPSFIELLRAHDVALVIAETARHWPMTHDITADFVYMRLHGDQELYRSGYGDKALERWARRIRAWSSGSEPEDAHKVLQKKPSSAGPRDVYCFFDNTDVKLRAPFDAQTLMRNLGLTPGSPQSAQDRRRVPVSPGQGVAARARAKSGRQGTKAAPGARATVGGKATPGARAAIGEKAARASIGRKATAGTKEAAGAKPVRAAKAMSASSARARTGPQARLRP
jgi:uncharacterized protein YecE (DUF72 family)